MIVDAHVHVACADEERYPRNPTGRGSQWWVVDGEVAQVDAHLVANHVDRAVIVQASGLYRHDCRCAADVVASDPERFALVAAIDLEADDLAAEVASCAQLGARGVRITPEGRGEPPAWLADGRGSVLWGAAAVEGLVLTPMVRSPYLVELAALCDRWPEVPVVLDHCGMSYYCLLYTSPSPRDS